MVGWFLKKIVLLTKLPNQFTSTIVKKLSIHVRMTSGPLKLNEWGSQVIHDEVVVLAAWPKVKTMRTKVRTKLGPDPSLSGAQLSK